MTTDDRRFKYLVLGSGMQGRACAYDLLQSKQTREVILADASDAALKTVKAFLNDKRVKTVKLDAADTARAGKLMAQVQVVVSCVPYFFNLPLAKAAVAAKANWVDLGGNTSIVLKELTLHEKAKKAGVVLLPDVGLGPGMTTTIAVHAMSMLDSTDEVLIRDGGLPQKPVPPMNYMLTFSEHGLINEYVEPAAAIRDYKLVEVPGLSEIETIEVPGLGRMEAAHAAGGLSTLGKTLEGKVRNVDCKLIRYPGHCAVINAMNAMGFFSQKKRTLRTGATLAPRDLAADLFREHFSRPGDEDMVIIHTTVRGKKDGRRAQVVCTMLDKYDRATKMTAMMRTTGFPAAIVAQMAANGEIGKTGAYPVETGIPPERFFAHFKARGFNLSFKLTYLEQRELAAA
jgi:lysine 6-dehydrogenase